MKKLSFGPITSLRDTHPFAALNVLSSSVALRAPRTAFQSYNFFGVNHVF